MAWMRLMGADSVAYHRETVLGRADDHPGAALAYYDSRGETPLRWGGSGASDLDLAGVVTDSAYEAIYGPGGARHPVSGDRLVRTLRPGMELVIAPHKSVAELGVIGRTADVHAIADAERDATLGYLDELTRRRGGRRGRAAVPSSTLGLLYAHTRHATSRAADPFPHDHVLIANVLRMTDHGGGYKAPDMTLWRDDLHAATMIGRLAGARQAVELGYAIEADPGRSGRLRHWRIAGIPEAACALHSKRSVDIDEAVAEHGADTYRARSVAARTTRRAKEHMPVAELVRHWQDELTAAGFPPAEMVASVEAAAAGYSTPAPLSPAEARMLAATVLAPGGPIRTKVFRPADVIVALGPELFGRPVEDLNRAVDAVLGSAEAIPLLRIRGARERHWAAAHTLVTEEAIAATVARGMASVVPMIPAAVVATAIAAQERRLGHVLTPGQRAAVEGICGSGQRAHLVVGIAGSGKTTALAAVRSAYQKSGYRVLGTATAGQAARTLEHDAGMPSRTLASLLWQLDHGRLNLGQGDVVILDEAGMTEDTGLLRLLTAAEVAGASVVLVGDDRQLGSVGPGGAMGALVARHQVHVLANNVRQVDAGERDALAELRAGDVDIAASWYVDHRRVETAPTPQNLIAAMADAWADDTLAGRDVAMLAWRRSNVAELNRQARQRWAAAGRLSGPEIEAAGGRRYAAGDRIVTLAPGASGRLVTSERGEVVSVDPATASVLARMDGDRLVRLTGEELGADRLDHAYATTVHRSQGMTVDVAHRLCDGGGRELAYVSMSRARSRSTAWVVADSVEQACEDLVRDWSHEARPRWAIDTGTPDASETPRRRRPVVSAVDGRLTAARLDAERQALRSVIPADPSDEVALVVGALRALRLDEKDLETGEGCWAGTEVGAAARERLRIHAAPRRAEEMASTGSLGSRRRWRAEARDLAAEGQAAESRFAELAGPVRQWLTTEQAQLSRTMSGLVARRDDRATWLHDHPTATERMLALESQEAALRMQARLSDLDRRAAVHDAPEVRLPGI